jgi:hypothetical protein
MSLATLIRSIEVDLTRPNPRSARALADARTRNAEIAAYATIADLQHALTSTSSLPIEARRALVTALVVEAQSGVSPLWSSILVVAFGPMLSGIRKKSGPRDDEDLDSAVLAAFLGAVRAVRAGPYTALSLRWVTEKEVVLGRIAAGRLGPMAAFDEDVHSPVTLHDTDEGNALTEVLRALEAEGMADILDVLVATRAGDESLSDYVRRTCPNPRERASRYEHLCRARLRLEREVRERMTPRAA